MPRTYFQAYVRKHGEGLKVNVPRKNRLKSKLGRGDLAQVTVITADKKEATFYGYARHNGGYDGAVAFTIPKPTRDYLGIYANDPISVELLPKSAP